MNFLLPDEPRPSNLPPLDAPPATIGERFGASRDIAQIQRDSWGRSQQHASDLLEELLAATGTSLDNVPLDSRRMANSGAVFRYRRDRALAAVAEARSSDPDSDIARLPGSVTEFDQAVLGRRQRELEEAQTILGRAEEGAWGAELAGALAGDATDPVTLLSTAIPFGRAMTIPRFLASEAAINAGFEAFTIGDQIEVADDLGMERPDFTTQVGAAGLLGAALGGTILGGVRGAQWLARRARAPIPPPPGVSPIDHEIAMGDAEAALLRGEDPSMPTPASLAAMRAPDDVVNRIIGVESAGNAAARNANSSAEGLGQFIDATWLEMIEKHRPDLMPGRSRRELLDLKFDPNLSREMTAAYVADNTAFLQARGLPVTPGSIYLAHFAGPEGAARALSAPPNAPIGTVLSRQQIAANRGIRMGGKSFAQFTVGDLRAWANRKMSGTAPVPASGEAPQFSTSRGFTGEGQIRVNDDLRIDVEYEVVDASILRQASGDLQPRDRSRINSDAWVAETAAGLDPALLRPAPTADRGTPIVGPDDVIESGNGRVRAIERAYERFPDRAAAYRRMIEAETGRPIPEDIERPVLVARRRTELDEAQRGQLVVDAQDSGVARMTPTEISQVSGRAMTADTLALLRPGVPIAAAENAGFVRRALGRLPASERNALFDATGALNAEGAKRLKNALFARAWPDRQLIGRYAELEDAGPLKSLLTALERAAPEWAALRSDIEAGLVRPEFDISPFVIDAMRLIGAAREASARGEGPIAKVLDELLAEVDLLEGALPDVTVALVRKFYPDGKPASADDVAEFLSDYARRARDVGQPTMLGDDVGPAALLRSIDGRTFAGVNDVPAPPARLEVDAADLPEAYELGAMSPEAEAADLEAMASLRETAELREGAEALRALDDDIPVDLGDGSTVRVSELLDAAEQDLALADVIDLCKVGGRGA